MIHVLLLLLLTVPSDQTCSSGEVEQCPWCEGTFSSHTSVSEMRCADDTTCDLHFDGPACCDCRGGVAQCPRFWPHLCESGTADEILWHCKTTECTRSRPCPSDFTTPRACSPSAPPSPPASPPLPPSPPGQPAPPFRPDGGRLVSSVAELYEAVHLAAADIVLSSRGSPYVLDGELSITHNLTLRAELDTESIVLDANASQSLAPRRVLTVGDGSYVELIGLTIQGARTGLGNDVPGGIGAIRNAGRLSMTRCVIRSNFGYASGLLNLGHVLMAECHIHSNQGLGMGTIFNAGYMYMRDSKVYDNVAKYGGGVVNDVQATLLVEKSIFEYNNASHDAGGLLNHGSAVVVGSAFEHNRAGIKSGGVQCSSAQGRLFMFNCTISSNEADSGGGVALFRYSTSRESIPNTTLDMIDCTVQYNRAQRGAGIFAQAFFNISNTKVQHNRAIRASGSGLSGAAGLYSDGRGFIGNGTLFLNNSVDDQLALGQLYNGGELAYVLPGPLGSYLPNVLKCEELMCLSPQNPAQEVPCTTQEQACKALDGTILEGLHISPIRQGSMVEEFPLACPKGFFGRGNSVDEQSRPNCTGRCPLFHFCDKPRLIQPKRCPAGSYTAEAGASDRSACLFCEQDQYLATSRASNPRWVDEWYANFSIGIGPCSSCPAHSLTRSRHGGTSERDCVCDSGYFTVGGTGPCLECKTEAKGGACPNVNTTLATILVNPGFWRPTANSLPVECPVNATCTGINEVDSLSLPANSARFDADTSLGCTGRVQGKVVGALCIRCGENELFEPSIGGCIEAAQYGIVFVLVASTILACSLSPCFRHGPDVYVHAERGHLLQRWASTARVKPVLQHARLLRRRLALALQRTVKPLKICISFYQILTQMPVVYRTHLPSAYEQLLEALNTIIDWLPAVRALTDISFIHQLTQSLYARLLVATVLPFVIAIITFLYHWARYCFAPKLHQSQKEADDVAARQGTSLQRALAASIPAWIVILFLLAPIIASYAFRAMRDCSCTRLVDRVPHGALGATLCVADDAQILGMCFNTLDTKLQCPVGIIQLDSCDSSRMRPVNASGDAASFAEYHATISIARVCVTIYALAVPAMFLIFLLLARYRGEISGRPRGLGRHLRFLYEEYHDHAWLTEIWMMLLKVILVGVLSLSQFNPGTPMQLFLALLTSLANLTFISWLQPYRQRWLNVLAVVSAASLQFMFLAFLSYSLKDTYHLELGYWHSFVFGVGVLCGVSVNVVLVLVFGYHLLKEQPRTVLWERDRVEVQVRHPRGGRSHIFCSHAWESGQDQAKTLQLLLSQLLPELQIYLDVDKALDRRPKRDQRNSLGRWLAARLPSTAALRRLPLGARSRSSKGGEDAVDDDRRWMQEEVSKSTVLVALLTATETRSDYFNSKNCMLELRTALREGKRIVFVLETDPKHGGTLTLSEHLKECRRVTINPQEWVCIRREEVLDESGKPRKAGRLDDPTLARELAKRMEKGEEVIRLGDHHWLRRDDMDAGTDTYIEVDGVGFFKPLEQEHASFVYDAMFRNALEAFELKMQRAAEQGNVAQEEMDARVEEAEAALENYTAPAQNSDVPTLRVVRWHRYRELQDVSVRIIAQHVLQEEAVRTQDATGTILVIDELTQQRWLLPHLVGNTMFHLYVSESNKGAVEFMRWFEKESRSLLGKGSPPLKWTHRREGIHLADNMLLYLSSKTWAQLGLLWVEIPVARDSRGAACLPQVLIKNRRLSKALLAKAETGERLEFSPAEFRQFKVRGLQLEAVVSAGAEGQERWFQVIESPSNTQLCEELRESQLERGANLILVHEARQSKRPAPRRRSQLATDVEMRSQLATDVEMPAADAEDTASMKYWWGAKRFDDLRIATPESIRGTALRSVAVPITDDMFSLPHGQVGLHVILRTLCASRQGVVQGKLLPFLRRALEPAAACCPSGTCFVPHSHSESEPTDLSRDRAQTILTKYSVLDTWRWSSRSALMAGRSERSETIQTEVEIMGESV